MSVHAYILIQTDVGHAAEVTQALSDVPGVVSADDVSGPYDVIVQAEARSIDALSHDVVAKIQALDGITRTLACPVVHL
jgi:DNA-binding Lrp family transcriptional regulator